MVRLSLGTWGGRLAPTLGVGEVAVAARMRLAACELASASLAEAGVGVVLMSAPGTASAPALWPWLPPCAPTCFARSARNWPVGKGEGGAGEQGLPSV